MEMSASAFSSIVALLAVASSLRATDSNVLARFHSARAADVRDVRSVHGSV
jgi:hypothetical protein